MKVEFKKPADPGGVVTLFSDYIDRRDPVLTFSELSSERVLLRLPGGGTHELKMEETEDLAYALINFCNEARH